MRSSERVVRAAKLAARAVLPQQAYGPIRAWRVHSLVDRYPSRTVRHRYGGSGLTVMLDDPLAEGWYDHDWVEPPEIAKLREGRLGPGARVFDVGAHQGVVALILAGVVGARGHVVAVEADPHNAAVARINVDNNGADNVNVIHAAGAAREGTASFAEGLNGVLTSNRAPGSVLVRAVTIDAMADRYGRPDVVLVDVEGYEGHVLIGAGETIAAGATDFFVELHDATAQAAAGSSADEVLGHFDPATFEVAVAVTTETAGGAGNESLAGGWQDLSSGVHLRGERCFLVARPRALLSERAQPGAGSKVADA